MACVKEQNVPDINVGNISNRTPQLAIFDFRSFLNIAMLLGGQRQKIALARALVHNSPVIIFDEAASNTDVYSEHQINGLLETKLKEKPVIFITHKQEILREAARIIMLKDGAVIGTGKYDDLIINNAEFKDMLRGQKT